MAQNYQTWPAGMDQPNSAKESGSVQEGYETARNQKPNRPPRGTRKAPLARVRLARQRTRAIAGSLKRLQQLPILATKAAHWVQGDQGCRRRTANAKRLPAGIVGSRL